MRSMLLRYLLCSSLALSAVAKIEAQAVSSTKKAQPTTFNITAKVDKRVELMSIIARLAGYGEYVNNQFKLYANDVDTYFEKYRQHPAVQFASKIRESNQIGFDAVMALAVHLNPPPALTPRVAFTDQVPDPRWGKSTALEFVKLLQQFYKDADCERFFQAHADLYRTAELRFQQLTSKVDFEWYRKFYGDVPKGSFNLYIGLLNGGGNYGPKVAHPDGTEDLYAIIGTWKVDQSGMPIYGDENLSTIIHEYNHSFINHLVFEHEQELRAAGEQVFRPVAEKMKVLAYGKWQTVLIESLVRTAVIRYEFAHGAKPEEEEEAILTERNLGFLWTEELFALLGTYENSRSIYPTFRSFFPLIVSYFKDLSQRIAGTAARFEKMTPHVIAIAPFANGAQDVDPNTTQLTFTFDKPLDPEGGYSFNAGAGGGAHYPIEKYLGYSENGNKFTVQVKLKPDWDYEFVLTGRGFRTRDSYPLQPYTVKFRTRKL
jgi:Domain of unknown function (DUF4932)